MNRDLLLEGMDQISLAPNTRQIELFELFVSEMRTWNRVINLVNAPGDKLLVYHVFDALSGCPFFSPQKGHSVLDVGTGGGFPGVPLAIMKPELQFFLLDRSEKKIAFLKNFAALSKMKNLFPIQASLQNQQGLYHTVCCRAFKPLRSVFDLLLSKVVFGGDILCYMGTKTAIDSELMGLEKNSALYRSCSYEIIPVQVPFLTHQRHLVRFRRTS